MPWRMAALRIGSSGSTAKLRTLVHYLEIIATLHQEVSANGPAAMRPQISKPRFGAAFLVSRILRDFPASTRGRNASSAPKRSMAATS